MIDRSVARPMHMRRMHRSLKYSVNSTNILAPSAFPSLTNNQRIKCTYKLKSLNLLSSETKEKMQKILKVKGSNRKKPWKFVSYQVNLELKWRSSHLQGKESSPQGYQDYPKGSLWTIKLIKAHKPFSQNQRK